MSIWLWSIKWDTSSILGASGLTLVSLSFGTLTVDGGPSLFILTQFAKFAPLLTFECFRYWEIITGIGMLSDRSQYL